DELLRAAFTMPLSADPGSRTEYSDVGFILLGVALERIADESPDRFCQREIFAPLGMGNTAFNPPKEVRAQIPPTADDRSFRLRIFRSPGLHGDIPVARSGAAALNYSAHQPHMARLL